MDSLVQPTPVASETLYAEHRIIRSMLGVLERWCSTPMAGSHVPDEVIAEVLGFFRTFADGTHRAKEERYLLPLLMQKGFPRARGPVALMIREHADLAQHLDEMERTLRVDRVAFAHAARAYVALAREHLAREENMVFPTADRLFTPDEQRALREGYARVDHDTHAQRARDEHTALLACLSAYDRIPD